MGNDLGILLGLLLLAYLFLTPGILIFMYARARRRAREMEADIEHLVRRLELLEDRGHVMPVQAAPDSLSVVPPAKDTEEPIEPEEPVAEEVPLPEPLEQPFPESVPTERDTVFVASQSVHAFAQAEESQPEAEDLGPSMGTRIRELMKGIGMWPPESGTGQDRETVLMRWWLPRIGGLLALLSALFFGVYISQDTSPVFKCMELLAASIGVTVLGRYMENRYRTFGGVVLVTGLLMLYLTSVAAYMLPATRVIASPVIGSLVQALVLSLISGVGWMRRSPGIVLLSIHLGCFLTVFMAWEGLREGCLIAAGLLFVAGLIISRNTLFRHVLYVAIPAAYLAVLAFPLIGLVRAVDLPGNISVQVYLNCVTALVSLSYLAGQMGKGRESRILLSIGSSLAILSLLWFCRSFYPDQMEWAALALGVNMLAGAIAGWSLRGCGFLAQLLFIKATFLIGVWAILHFAGDLRWMVLCLQTVVVGTAARRSGRVAMEVATWAVAVASLVFFTDGFQSLPDQGSFVWWMMVLYPGIITLALGYVLSPIDMPGDHPFAGARRPAYALVPLVASGLWWLLFTNTPARSFDMALPFVGILYAFAVLSRIPLFTRWYLLLTTGVSFVLSNLYFWNEPFSLLILAALSVASGLALVVLCAKPGPLSEILENGVSLLWFSSISLWMLQILNDWKGQGIVMFLLAAGILLAGLLPRMRHVGAWAFLPPLICILTETVIPGGGSLNLLAYIAGLGWLAVPMFVPGVCDGLGWGLRKSVWSLIGAVTFWCYAVHFGDPEATWISGQVVFGVIGLILLVASWRWPVPGYLLGAILFVGVVAGRHLLAMTGPSAYAPWRSEALLSGSLLYGFALAWFLFRPVPFPELAEPRRQRVLQLCSAASAILFFLTSVVTFQYEALGWLDFYTPILAVTAFSMILLGMFRNDAVFRRLGLAALLIPLVRLFLVDVQDVLHRIVAFAAAAVLLTLLGYVYNRIASRHSGGNAG